ncbi:MarR family transcriptional regulator [Polaribacter sp. HL-MS24]|uniref:MarR family winged helix-turn-helix transcriptional regulator n=1 Tax=Polaribacter sp. HL-MS24 TaxID=3077735 RepID=UPI0029346F08|nr:MarR family transcriptional regulator [Polaribacter sp. HL-MS24]WOC41268.1 MarR family transcriptional regulator [Polaribacter sp. HL-MS24]
MQLNKVFSYLCLVNKEDIHIDFENSIGPWIGKTVKLMDYIILESLKSNNLDLTKEQMIVLKNLHETDGLNQNDLAFLTLRNKSSLTRLLAKMESKNYILRKQSPTDKRVNNVFLTDLGKETFNKTKPVIKEMITTMELGISKEEKDQMIKTLKKVQTNFNSNSEFI